MPAHEHIRQCLSAIFVDWKGTSVTFMFRGDTSTISDYGEPTKDVTNVAAEGIISPVNNVKDWMPEGLVPDSDLLCIVWEVESGGINYLTDEYFNQENFLNIWVLIGEIYYRVIAIRSPESIHSVMPYWVTILRKLEMAPSS